MTQGLIPNILVVDDDIEIREHTCATLAGASYRCLGVSDARTALRTARTEPIDVALVNTGEPPAADGLWLTRRLRSQVRDLAVVLLTRTPDLDGAVEAMRAGVIDYLFKPFSADEVIGSVERAVEWRRNAVRARATSFDLEQAIVDRVGALRNTFGAAKISSAAALDALVDQLYAENRSALQHVRRVARHSTRVAAQLGVVEPQLVAIRHAGLLHDIGKLALPQALLTK